MRPQRRQLNCFFQVRRIAGFSILFFLLACAPSSQTTSPPRLPNGDELPSLLIPDGGAAPVRNAGEWESLRRPQLKQLFSEYVYGYSPPRPEVSFKRRVIDSEAFNGLATFEEISISIGSDAVVQVVMLLAVPNKRSVPPVFLMLNKCGNHSLTMNPKVPVTHSWVDASVCEGPGQGRGLRADRYQLEFLLTSGYAVATFHESDIDPDREELRDSVRTAFPVDSPADQAWGMLAAWAWGLERAVDVLVQVGTVDPTRIAVYGHSRRGKAALLAAAYDERIRLVIANQSGTGGATLSRSMNGESVNYINHRFPWWFNDVFPLFNDRENELPVDQHQLIALVAPRSVFLANAHGDAWADPEGALLAARAAYPAWQLYGGELFTQPVQSPTNFAAPLAYHIRDGGHTVSRDDWQVFVRYADKQFSR